MHLDSTLSKLSIALHPETKTRSRTPINLSLPIVQQKHNSKAIKTLK